MRKHRIIKFFGLTVIYAAIIIGIFVLQFKTETIISRFIGGMEISLSSTQDKDGNDVMKNQFRVDYKGFTFSANENNPVKATLAGSEKQNLTLSSWQQDGDNEVSLLFTDGTKISFASSQTAASGKSLANVNAPLINITMDMPENYESISIPYTISSVYNVSNGEDGLLVTKEKDNENFVFAGPTMLADSSKPSSGYMSFSQSNKVALYRSFVPIKVFEFASVSGMPLANQDTYNKTKSALRNEIRTKFNSASNIAGGEGITEKAVMAYVADMAHDSKFNMALNVVPASFKDGSARTFRTSPFFARLISSNTGLRAYTKSMGDMIRNAALKKDLSIFEVENIAEYLLLQKKTPIAVQVLAIPASGVFEPTLKQAYSILDVYSKIDEKDASFADNLGSSIPVCLETITKYLTLEGSGIKVGKRADEKDESREDVSLSRTEKIRLGQALINYGDTVGDTSIMETGRLIVNQEAVAKDMTLDEIADIYPEVLRENKFYPHTEILGYYGNNPVWAWTCAPSITYNIENDGTTDINIDFTNSYTHYAIFTGIPTFHMNIEIQKLSFHTDPQFEKWNSSGFAYDEGLNTFYLKSRHKSKIELIRLFCDPVSNFTPVSNK